MKPLHPSLTVSSFPESESLDPELERVVEAAVTRLQAGESFDVVQFAAEHPKHADELRRLLPMIAALVKLPGAVGDRPDAASTHGEPDSPAHKQLGDFRLIRELGRGGMGTVFEAEQLSMGRRVALKVLPFAALAHDKSLQRFRNEVRAAAALDHPNIVSVYSVGEERGVHYYAMQLIRGGTLAELISDLQADRPGRPQFESPRASDKSTQETQGRGRTSLDSRQAAERYRSVARLGIQAAEALQNAHDQGVLHRDIKPSNLMLDADGKLYVTDFGLARIEADAGLTMTGDLIGTLRYMAPEQALANRVVIDHRADIYSLGATFYELLTLQKAFGESDRADLLKQIAFDEPTSPRKLDRRIPVELETIVQKAMAKSPDERYQSAEELADDLRSFLELRPIKAKPPSPFKRLIRWSQRHTAVVWSALAATAVVLIISVASGALVTRWYLESKAQRLLAEERRSVAIQERARAESLVAKMKLRRGSQLLENHQALGLLDLVEASTTGGETPTGRAARRLWSIAFQDLTLPIAGTFRGAACMALSSDSDRIATGGVSRAYIWEIPAGRILLGPFEIDGYASALSFSPDGKLIAVSSSRGVTRVWSAQTGAVVSPELRVEEVSHERRIYSDSSVVFSPDGKLLAASAFDGTVQLWRTDSWEPHAPAIQVATLADNLKFSRDGSQLVIGTVGGMIHIWDMKSEKIQLVLQKQRWLQFVVNENLLYTINDKHVIVETDLHQNSSRPLFRCADAVLRAAMSPTGGILAVADQRWNLQLWDVKAGRPLNQPTSMSATTLRMAFNSGGSLLAVFTSDDSVQLWNVATQSRVGVAPPLDRNVRRIEFDPTGEYLIGLHEKLTRIWQVAGATEKTDSAVIEHRPQQEVGSSATAAVRLDGLTDGTSAVDGLLTIPRGKDSPFELELAGMRCVALSKDGERLVTASSHRVIATWDVSSGRQLSAIATNATVCDMTYSALDPSLFAVADFGGAVRLWRGDLIEAVGQPMRHEAPVWDLAFDPSGNILATISGADARNCDTIRLWDISAEPPYSSVTLPYAPIVAADSRSQQAATLARFSATGELWVKSYPDQAIRRWQMPAPTPGLDAMQLETWLALGSRYVSEGVTKSFTKGEWDRLRVGGPATVSQPDIP